MSSTPVELHHATYLFSLGCLDLEGGSVERLQHKFQDMEPSSKKAPKTNLAHQLRGKLVFLRFALILSFG
jgi:hypothetical protein